MASEISAKSNSTPLPAALEQQCTALAASLEPGETFVFLSHHKGGAGLIARQIKDRLCDVMKLPSTAVFLDSDQLAWSLNDLLDKVRKSRVLIVIQTKETFHRPFVIGEVVAALEAGIAIIAVVDRHGKYDFQETSAFLSSKDFREALERDSPGCVDVLESQGIDVGKAGELLRREIPSLISIEVDFNANHRRIDVMYEDIVEALLSVKKKNTAKKPAEVEESEFVLSYKQAEKAKDYKKMGRLASMDRSILPMFVRFVIDSCKNDKDGVENADFAQNQTNLRMAGACDIVVEALEDWGTKDAASALEILTACRFLARDFENKKKFALLGGCEAVLKVVSKWGMQDNKVAAEGCAVIVNLALDVDNAKRFGLIGACDVVDDMLNKFKDLKNVALFASAAVWTLASTDENKRKFGLIGGCATILEVLNKWGMEDSEIAMEGFMAIANLAMNADNARKLGRMEACEFVLLMLQKWGMESNSKGAERGCFAMANLSASDVENKKKFGSSGGCQVLVQVLNKWATEDNKVATEGLMAMANLAANAENAKKFGSIGACELVVNVLKTYGVQFRKLAWYGCWAMANLTIDNDNTKRFASIGGCEIVVQVLERWGNEDKGVALFACFAMGSLACSADNRKKMALLGGCEAVVQVLNNWGMEDKEVAENVCDAIKSLQVGNSSNAKLLDKLGATKLVKEVKKKWKL